MFEETETNNEINTIKYKHKKDEISKITTDLKSHYLIEEFFVDPDKKFFTLLERIIVKIIYLII